MLTMGVSRPCVGFWWLREPGGHGGSAQRLPGSSGEHFLTGPRGCFLGTPSAPSGCAPLKLPMSLDTCHLRRQLGPAGAAGASLILFCGPRAQAPPAAGPFSCGAETLPAAVE